VSQIYSRSEKLADYVYDIKLKIPEWKILFAVDGEMDSQTLASFLEMLETEVNSTLQKLERMNLITSGLEADEVEQKSSESEEITITGLDTLEQEEEQEEDFATLDFEKAIEEEPTPETGEPTPETGEAEPEIDIFEQEEDETEFSLPEEVTKEEKEQEIEDSTVAPTDEEPAVDDDFGVFIDGLLSEEEEATKPLEAYEEPQPKTEEELPDLDVDESQITEAAEETAAENIDLGNIFEEEIPETDQLFTEEEVEVAEPAEQEQEEEPVMEAPAPEMPVPSGEKKTVLVVDDSVVIRKMVEIALENENYNIVSVPSGKEALNYLDNEDPAVIILDIMLPDVNGLDILKTVKASKQIPVVILSAKDTPRETARAKELGADDFIPKPFKDEELVYKIRELIDA
jgi:CheY-like chemotaxis protein